LAHLQPGRHHVNGKGLALSQHLQQLLQHWNASADSPP
jgi:hypothetical protein